MMDEAGQDIFNRAAEFAVLKDSIRRFQISTYVLDQLLKEGPSLVGSDISNQESNWRLCAESVFELWESSACLWKNGKYPAATALAISALEEVGKLSVERMRIFGVCSIKFSDEQREALDREWNLRNKPFLDHFTKSVLAVMSGALINSRLDRVVGLDFVIEFLARAERGELEQIRQNCLYLNVKQQRLILPQDAVTVGESLRFVALAGEVLAEIMFDPDQWMNHLKVVMKFEEESGLPFELQ